MIRRGFYLVSVGAVIVLLLAARVWPPAPWALAVLETKPFGTHRDVYRVGYEWVGHSIAPVTRHDAQGATDPEPRIAIGARDCRHPYTADPERWA